jgi:hypothetical protein
VRGRGNRQQLDLQRGRGAAAGHDQIWAAAGHLHTVFPTTYTELVQITGGTPADVGE